MEEKALCSLASLTPSLISFCRYTPSNTHTPAQALPFSRSISPLLRPHTRCSYLCGPHLQLCKGPGPSRCCWEIVFFKLFLGTGGRGQSKQHIGAPKTIQPSGSPDVLALAGINLCVCVCVHTSVYGCICFPSTSRWHFKKMQVQGSKIIWLYLNKRCHKYIYLALKDCRDSSLIALSGISTFCSMHIFLRHAAQHTCVLTAAQGR